MPVRFHTSGAHARTPIHGLRPLAVLVGSVLVAAVMSTQFLFQSFVWRHWPWDEVMLGWLEIARDRMVVALAIGCALIAANRLSATHARVRSLALGIAILAGATAGELALLAGGAAGAPGDLASVAGRIARWSVVAGSVAVLSHLWRSTRDATAAVHAVELRRVQTQRQAAATQLCALRGQIEPHFLFNTLATVRRLHQTDPAQGAPLLGHFISYLRSTQPDASAGGTLAEELALTSAYLGIIAARMSGRLQVEYEIQEDVRQTPFPPLTIATLVENAVKHGIAPVPEGGTICVSVKAVSGSLEAVVSDTGAGFVGTSGTGIGLANIRARLHTLYGSAGTLSLRANTPRGVRAAIRIPLASEAAA